MTLLLISAEVKPSSPASSNTCKEHLLVSAGLVLKLVKRAVSVKTTACRKLHASMNYMKSCVRVHDMRLAKSGSCTLIYGHKTTRSARRIYLYDQAFYGKATLNAIGTPPEAC